MELLPNDLENDDDVVALWLTCAEQDLKAARLLAKAAEPLFDMAVFHCQQAAKKALCGFLALHDDLTATDDIHMLVVRAHKHESKFKMWLDTDDILTAYATEYHHPSDFSAPDAEEFYEALDTAEKLVAFVEEVLAEE